ncbi:hypothetical protein [Methanobrevibacter sp.]|uniref:hypothetical protein n=1 Tax=Methanobrevibacter sp. TaxID=66852 RepID=UPI00388D130D
MVANFSVDIKFNDSYYKKLGLDKKAGYEDALDVAVDHAIHDAENICRREAPINTGNLRRSIHRNRPGKCQRELRARGAPYWVYVQYGSAPHIIRPKHAKLLAWKDKDGKHFAKEVHHPGNAANPFVTRTARKVKPKLTEYVLEELKRAGILD